MYSTSCILPSENSWITFIQLWDWLLPSSWPSVVLYQYSPFCFIFISFSFLPVMSQYKASVLRQLSTDQVVTMRSNLEFKTWITDINASTMSQDQLKDEAVKFSPILANLNKKTIMKHGEDFVKAEKKELSEVSMMIFKEMGGTEGKKRGRFDIPPRTYSPKNFKDFKMTKLDHQNE